MIHNLVFDDTGKFIGRDLNQLQLRSALGESHQFVWVDLENATEDEAHSILGEDLFNFHPLAINDCHEAISTPKAEVYEGVEPWRSCLFIVVHGVEYSRANGVIQTTELDAFAGKNFLVTWHTTPLRAVTQTFERCVKTTPKGVDRLLHTILDFLVDNYQPVIDNLSEQNSALQDQVFADASPKALNQILAAKRQITHLRQIIGPQREVIGRLARGEFKLIRSHLQPYFRDVQDALVRLGYSIDGYSDQLTNTLQVYLSRSNNEINEVVKVLTVINAISLPAVVFASIYGMNFKHMPELEWKYGYVWALALIFGSTAAILGYMKRKRWF